MKIPNFTLPKAITRLGRCLPSSPPEIILVLALNRLLKSEVLAEQIDLLAGKRFAIDILDAGLSLHFAAEKTGFRLDFSKQKADLRFAANAADFSKIMLRQEDPDTLFFNRRLIIEGDTELGLIVKNMLDSIDWSCLPYIGKSTI